MKKLSDVYQIDAFTKQPFQGNSAAVVLNDDLNKDEMQQIAKEMNLSETAFISNSDKSDFNLRWFTPTVEVKLCGHATIASIHYLKERGIISDKSEFTFTTRSGTLTCKSEGDLYFMQLPILKLEEFKGDKTEILIALGIDEAELNVSYPSILVEGGYLYIYLEKIETLKSLNPDYKKLYGISNGKNVFSVVTVFTTETFEPENHAHLRFFAPYFGIDEDPVTGSANGPLLMVMRKLGLLEHNTENKIFTFEQGDIMGRKGRIKVTYSPLKDELYIAGNAVTVFKGELTF
jgi:PhzF family phenazine biosynthesis protein